MSEDDQQCPQEGAPHDAHCVWQQGHWMCPGELPSLHNPPVPLYMSAEEAENAPSNWKNLIAP